MAEFSIIIPTLGRNTLKRALDSIYSQSSDEDEVQLVFDGADSYNRSVEPLKDFGDLPIKSCCETVPELSGCPGATQRNWAIDAKITRGTHILWLGDDDVYRSGALDRVRYWCDRYPDKCLMFKMYTFWHTIVWGDEPELREGNVSDHIFVAPNIPANLGRYTNRYAGDFDFIRETVYNFGGESEVIWVPEIIVQCRPEGE